MIRAKKGHWLKQKKPAEVAMIRQVMSLVWTSWGGISEYRGGTRSIEVRIEGQV